MATAGPKILIIAHSSSARDCHLWMRIMISDRRVHLLLPGSVIPDWVSESPIARRVRFLPRRSLGSETSGWLSGLRRVLWEVQPDLIHVDAEAWSFTVQWLVRSDWPVVAHGAENVINRAPWVYRRRRVGLRYVLQRLSGYAAWGATSLQAILDAGLPVSTPTCVVPARPPSPHDFPNAAMREAASSLRVAAIGRFERAKGFDTVIEAARLASEAGPLELSFMGDGPDLSRLTKLAVDACIPAQFHVSGDHVQVRHLIAASDVVVVPSRCTAKWTEQWCRVAAEALLTGRPVFASATGELPNTVGVADWLFNEGDVHQLAGLMNSIRPLSERTRAASVAVQQSRRFDLDESATQIMALWNEVRRVRASGARKWS